MAEITEQRRQQNWQANPAPVYTPFGLDGHGQDFSAELLEGKGSQECSCRITDMSALGEPVFTCCEASIGSCMYRVSSEPDLKCLYCLERFEGDRTRKACIREEAQDYARRQMYEDTVDVVVEQQIPPTDYPH